MNFRMLELITPPDTSREAQELVEDEHIFGIWTDDLDNGYRSIRVLLDADKTEKVSDLFTENFSEAEGFRIMLYAVEATVPQPDTEEKGEDDDSDIVGRISREELYSDVSSGSELSRVYIGTVILSTLVAAVGLIRNDVAVIIGAMVIAPLLGPNVSLALAVTLGDTELGWQSVKTNTVGLAIAFVVAFLMGLLLHVDPESRQIISRTSVSMGDITIAMAAGSAGVLAFTRGIPATIIGVMVAIALLPALASVGLLLGAGHTQLAIGAAILTVTNLVAINLAGVLTFLIQGVRPRSWWEAKKAKKATRNAIAIWFGLLVVFAIIIWLWGNY